MLSEPGRVVTRGFTGGIPLFANAAADPDPAQAVNSASVEREDKDRLVTANPRVQTRRIIDRDAGIGLLMLILSVSGLFIVLVNVSHILASRGMRVRKNVGIMMALGASRSPVLRLLGAENAFIAAAGAVIGGLFAIPLSRAMESTLGLSTASGLYVLLGVPIAWALTLVFSLVPAWRGSRVVPAEAMRSV